MLTNCKYMDAAKHVEFVSYTGKWPNLCRGVLTLRIDGKLITFGDAFEKPKTDHEKFWSSGGECTMQRITTDEWLINVQKLPDAYRKYAAEIDEVFNENVEYGCCGGCR